MNAKRFIQIIAAASMLYFTPGYAQGHVKGYTQHTPAHPNSGFYKTAPLQLAQNRYCKKRMGPYATQGRAWQLIRYYKSRGYQTSGVWGSGGIYSGSRGYYFNIFYRC